MSKYAKIIVKGADSAWAQQMALAVGQDFAQRHYDNYQPSRGHLYWYRIRVYREEMLFRVEKTKHGTIVVEAPWDGWEPVNLMLARNE